MSIFSKLAFWKKDGGDDFDFGKDMPGFNDNFQQNDPFQQQMQQQPKVPRAFEEEVDPTGGDLAKQFSSTTYSEPKGHQQQDFFSPQKPFSVMQPQSDQGYHAAKDFEIVSSKLDALRSAIESMNQRLINVEDLLRREKKDKYW